MSDFAIEKGVPFPPEDYRGGGRPLKRQWNLLGIGDSVLLPTENAARSGLNWAIRNERTFTIQKQADGSGWRIWRKA